MKLDKLPESLDPTLNLDEIRNECQALIRQRALISAAVSAVPVPLADLVIDAGILSSLLPEISARFGLIERDSMAHQQSFVRRGVDFVKLVATRGILRKSMQGLGKRIVVEQVAKFIPLGGQLVAATISYQVMKKIANDHIDECYSIAKKLQANARGKGHVFNGSAKAL